MFIKTKGIRFALLLSAALAAVTGLLWTATGENAPDVEFKTITGERFRLRDWRGHPVLVSFWASDCRACLEEIPDLSALQRDYAARGFRLIAVAMPYDPPNRIVAAARENKLPYPVAIDPLGQAADAFGPVRGVPASFLIAPDGRIILRHLGRLHSEDLRAPIERLLGKCDPCG